MKHPLYFPIQRQIFLRRQQAKLAFKAVMVAILVWLFAWMCYGIGASEARMQDRVGCAPPVGQQSMAALAFWDREGRLRCQLRVNPYYRSV